MQENCINCQHRHRHRHLRHHHHHHHHHHYYYYYYYYYYTIQNNNNKVQFIADKLESHYFSPRRTKLRSVENLRHMIEYTLGSFPVL